MSEKTKKYSKISIAIEEIEQVIKKKKKESKDDKKQKNIEKLFQDNYKLELLDKCDLGSGYQGYAYKDIDKNFIKIIKIENGSVLNQSSRFIMLVFQYATIKKKGGL